MKNSQNNHAWGIVALFSAGFLGGFAALAASMSLYIGTLTTTVTGVLFLSETLTPFIIFGGIMLLFGVYISTILPLQLERKKSAK